MSPNLTFLFLQKLILPSTLALLTLPLFTSISHASPCKAMVENEILNGECKGVLKHGEFIGYHTNGMPSWVVHFKNDVLHGKFTHFYPNGNIHFTGSYKDGKLHGSFKQYNIYNERLNASFKHGVLHGWLYTYGEDDKRGGERKLEALKYYYGTLKLKKFLN